MQNTPHKEGVKLRICITFLRKIRKKKKHLLILIVYRETRKFEECLRGGKGVKYLKIF